MSPTRPVFSFCGPLVLFWVVLGSGGGGGAMGALAALGRGGSWIFSTRSGGKVSGTLNRILRPSIVMVIVSPAFAFGLSCMFASRSLLSHLPSSPFTIWALLV